MNGAILAGACLLVQCLIVGFGWWRTRQFRIRYARLQWAHEALREALQEIQREPGCGCKPCTGQCRSAESMAAELHVRQDMARLALDCDARMLAPVIGNVGAENGKPLPPCERPIPHVGLSADHHSFMDRLICSCDACVAWRRATAPLPGRDRKRLTDRTGPG